MMKRFVILGALLLAAAPSSAEAQRSRGSRPIELGVDGGLFFGLDDPNVTVVTLPVQSFRVGFHMTNKVAIEPAFHLNSVRFDGGSATDYAIQVGLVYSPSGDRVGKGLYGRPFVGISGQSTPGPNDDSDVFIGIGGGLKIPFVDRRLATRMEVNYTHTFSDPSANVIGLLFGLSFFTR